MHQDLLCSYLCCTSKLGRTGCRLPCGETLGVPRLQVQNVQAGVVTREAQDAGQHFAPKVFVDQASTRQLGVEAMTQHSIKGPLVVVYAMRCNAPAGTVSTLHAAFPAWCLLCNDRI